MCWGLLRITFYEFSKVSLMRCLGFNFTSHISSTCSKHLPLWAVLLVGIKSDLLLNASVIKKKKKKEERLNIYGEKNPLLIWAVRRYSMCIWSSFNAAHPTAVIRLISVSFTATSPHSLSAKRSDVMRVELRYLMLLCPLGLFVSCQWLSTFIPAPLCLQAHAARN